MLILLIFNFLIYVYKLQCLVCPNWCLISCSWAKSVLLCVVARNRVVVEIGLVAMPFLPILILVVGFWEYFRILFRDKLRNIHCVQECLKHAPCTSIIPRHVRLGNFPIKHCTPICQRARDIGWKPNVHPMLVFGLGVHKIKNACAPNPYS